MDSVWQVVILGIVAGHNVSIANGPNEKFLNHRGLRGVGEVDVAPARGLVDAHDAGVGNGELRLGGHERAIVLAAGVETLGVDEQPVRGLDTVAQLIIIGHHKVGVLVAKELNLGGHVEPLAPPQVADTGVDEVGGADASAIDETDEVAVVNLVVGRGLERGVPLVGDVRLVRAQSQDGAEGALRIVEPHARGERPQLGVAIEEAGETLLALVAAIIICGVDIVRVEILVAHARSDVQFAPRGGIAEGEVVVGRREDLLRLDLKSGPALRIVLRPGRIVGLEMEPVDVRIGIEIAFFEHPDVI